MSRIGKKPVPVPAGVTATVDGQKVTAKGPKGELFFVANDEVSVKLEDNAVVVQPVSQTKDARSKWGMSRTMIENIFKGVKDGYERKLEINGVGYRASMQGKNLQLALGFSRYPCLETAGIKRWVNGAFTFSPDGNPLVGPVRGVPNYWVACGVMAGFLQGGGVGKSLAEWMIHGEPEADVYGMDIARYGGCYAVTKALAEEFGEERILDTPLSESACVGAGVGAAMTGMRPIVEIMTVNFSMLALDQIVNNAATIPYMSGGQFAIPLVIRPATGGGRERRRALRRNLPQDR